MIAMTSSASVKRMARKGSVGYWAMASLTITKVQPQTAVTISPAQGQTPQQHAQATRTQAEERASPRVLPQGPLDLPNPGRADLHLAYRGERIQGRSMPLDDLTLRADVVDGAIAHNTEARPKSATPVSKARRRPKMSPIRPAGTMKAGSSLAAAVRSPAGSRAVPAAGPTYPALSPIHL